MDHLRKTILSLMLLTAIVVPCNTVARGETAPDSVQKSGPVAGQAGEVEFRVGSSTTTVIKGARVIVILHDGKVIATGRTDAAGRWTTRVPFYQVQWNAEFSTKGIVNAIVIADGYNEQVVFVIPITAHTIQPVVLQPIVANGRNLPSASLGNLHQHTLRHFVDHYAELMGLQRQKGVPGDFDYAPWSPEYKPGASNR